MAFDFNPNSSTSAEMFSTPASRRIALASGGIFGCPLPSAKETPLSIIVEVPRAVRGVERKIKWDKKERATPASVILILSNV